MHKVIAERMFAQGIADVGAMTKLLAWLLVAMAVGSYRPSAWQGATEMMFDNQYDNQLLLIS